MIVKPNAPFVRWTAQIFGDSMEETRAALDKDHTAYLLPETQVDHTGISPDLLMAVYEEIFERELAGWCTDEGPSERTLDLFLEWFELECRSVAFDLDRGPLLS